MSFSVNMPTVLRQALEAAKVAKIARSHGLYLEADTVCNVLTLATAGAP